MVIVTGASKGIGRELTTLLAETGAVVVPTARTDEIFAAIAAEAKAAGLTVHPQRLDVRDVGSITAAAGRDRRGAWPYRHPRQQCRARLARAAFDVTEDDWDEMMGVNLRGMFFMSQAVARNSRSPPARAGASSISVRRAVSSPCPTPRSTAPARVANMMTKTLAVEWAPHDITVNALAPTFIYTPGTAPILDEPAMKAKVLGKIPLGKFALTDDVAGAVVYLGSDAGRMVTGTVLVIDGGWTAQWGMR